MKTARRFLLTALILLVAFASCGRADDKKEPKENKDAADTAPPKPDPRQLLDECTLVAQRPIFSSDDFPQVDFTASDLVKAALGPYSLQTRFFDSGYAEVQRPAGPGRYGAVVDVKFASGLADTKYLTLYKTVGNYVSFKNPYAITMEFPAEFGLPHEIVNRERWNVQNFYDVLIRSTARSDDDYAVLVAALHDMAAEPARWQGYSFGRVEDDWWDGLRKKLGEAQEYPHLVALPDGYDKDKDQRWPLIVFLHGSGERGNDLSALKDKGPQGFINAGHPLPFIVVTPQCPRREWWSPRRVGLLVDEIQEKYRVDPKRIYITGLSMGGYGTFDVAAAYPERFAAIAPVAGGENPDIAQRIKSVPTWIFHGAEDGVVPTRYSTAIADKMKQLGADVKVTLYPNVAHEKWEITYDNPDLYAWFLQHSLP
jgi:predicted esterase